MGVYFIQIMDKYLRISKDKLSGKVEGCRIVTLNSGIYNCEEVAEV